MQTTSRDMDPCLRTRQDKNPETFLMDMVLTTQTLPMSI